MSDTVRAAPASVAERQTAYWRPSPRSIGGSIGIVLLAVAAVLVILRTWGLAPFQGTLEETDNAYVRGRVTVISPQVSGYIVTVPVTDFADVKAGQILARIDDRIYRARVAQARANLDAARANLANNDQALAARSAGILNQLAGAASANAQLQKTQADMMRAADLVKDGSISVREHDETLASLRAAKAQVQQAQAAGAIARQDLRTVQVGKGSLIAQVEAAEAELRSALVDLEHTVIRAPEGGRLSEVSVRLGQYVSAGTQLMSLVPGDRWIIADYKESQTAHLAVGQTASFTVDALAGRKFAGRVEQLSPAAGSEFAVLKPDNATGNFVKVPQRIGVRIKIDPDQSGLDRLRPGMSVETIVDTEGGPR